MENVQLLPENEVKEVEGRYYINPQVGIDETNTFIDKFRDTQKGDTQEIAEQTQMLGTDVPSSLGGLTGAGNYFTSRYQTPQTNAVVQNLRAAAQATALNNALSNEQEMWKKRYNDAYKAYQKRQNAKQNAALGGGGNGGNGGGNDTLNVNTNNGQTTQKVDTFEETPGSYIPMTDTSGKYQDPKTGQWFMLTNPNDFDMRVIENSLQGQNPKDGITFSANGKVFRYLAGPDSWYQQVYLFGQG